MNSCLYTGRVRHRRFKPQNHGFRYRLFMLYLDLDELQAGQIFQRRWLWSNQRWALARFRRSDHFGDPNKPLVDCVRERVFEETGHSPSGPIRLLTQLRYFGYCINPISIYYCFNHADTAVEAIVAEVTNTPWGERHCYVLHNKTDASGQQHYSFAKCLHVSPFMPMQLNYRWRSNQPSQRLAVQMDVCRGYEKLFDATLGLRRQAISGRSLALALLRFPWMTATIAIAIYWQALRLWLKGVPVFDHPTKSTLLEKQNS